VQSRRRLGTAAIAAISALCIGLVLAACGGGSSSGGSSGGGGTLTVAVIDDLRSADNILVGSTTNDRAILGSTVYDPLFSTDENAQPVPALALGATPSDEAKTWTITLRQGVKFTNGKDFTARTSRRTSRPSRNRSRRTRPSSRPSRRLTSSTTTRWCST
jgi:peptide/nickel transport system substrate-binding protein